MANKKISELNSASLPLSGTEEIPIVQGGETKKVAVSEFGGVTSVTGDSVDNANPLTPIINAIPLSGTTEGNTVIGQINFSDGVPLLWEGDASISSNELSLNLLDRLVVNANPLGRGVSGLQDFTGNITDLDYTQKIYVDTELNTKQDTLVSATNIKTINGNSVLGSGNLVVSGSNVVTEINTTGTASSGTAETITYSVLIPANTMSVGVYNAITRVNKTGTAGIVTVNMYVNNTNDLTTPILIGRSVSTSTGLYMPLQKFIDIKVLNGTGLGTEVANKANNATFSNDYIQHGNTGGLSNVAIDWTIDQYLIVTVTNSSAGDSSTGTFLILKK